MSVLRGIATSALVAACATACMAPEPPPEPFHTGLYGPGLEVNLPGNKVQLLGSDEAVRYNLRIADSALRIYDASSVRLGSVAVREGQLKISGRDAVDVCTAQRDGVNAVVVECSDDVTVSATHDDRTWTFAGDGGQAFSLSMNGDGMQWLTADSSQSGFIDVSPETVSLANDGETIAQLSGRSRVPRKERAVLLAAGHALSESASSVEAIAWFSAAWIVVHASSNETEANQADTEL